MKSYILEHEQESERLNFQAQNHNYDPVQELSLDEVELLDGQRVLDAGCGSGILTKTLLQYNGNICVDAVDFSSSRINKLKNEFADSTFEIRFLKEDLRELPFKNSTFDKVFCRFVYQHNPLDAQIITEELFRVLRPRGKIIIIDNDGVFYGLNTENDFLSEKLALNKKEAAEF